MMVLVSEQEVRDAYKGEETATRYVGERFVSELPRLLHDRQVAVLQRLMDVAAPRRVLEIAPGPGRLTRDVRPSGSLICLEYNEGMIREGRRSCTNKAQWVRGNGFRLPFDQEFDLVYTFRFIRHFHRADRERLYGEIRRVLRPGGNLVLDAVNERVSQPLRQANPDDYPIHDELYRPDQLRHELAGAGLVVTELVPVQKWFRWQYQSQVLLGPRANWLNRMVIRTLERLPSRDGLEWIVTCRRA
jgi:malonyl-CoA O-methyltransferase